MKTIILSAGQGTRLLPHTQETPKCLLPLNEETNILRWQLDQLERAGVTETVVVTGFHAEKVEEEIKARRGKMKVRTLFNPFYKVADNLGSVWIAREEMNQDFIILNGDTLFTANVAADLIKNAQHPLTMTVAFKEKFDSDDMKITLNENGTVHSVGKLIPLEDVDAESIGMILFKGKGPKMFKDAVETVMTEQASLKRYYLTVIDMLAKGISVGTSEAEQSQWCEVDFPLDFERAQKSVQQWHQSALGQPYFGGLECAKKALGRTSA